MISALSNSATICRKEKSYFLWGINDKVNEIEVKILAFSSRYVIITATQEYKGENVL